MTEKNFVEVKLHDLFLVQFAFDLPREQDFIELARVGLLRAQEKISSDLHGYGTSAAGFSTGGRNLVGGSAQRIKINARMIPELIILNRDHRINQVTRNLVEFHGDTAMFSELGQQDFILVINAQRHLVLRIFKMLDGRQCGNQNSIDIKRPCDQNDRTRGK